MSDTTGNEYGPRLARRIDELRGDMSVREFARQHRLDNTRISAWRGGATPRLDHLPAAAEGLGLTVGELLLVMGIGQPEDFTTRVASVADAIEADRTIDDELRQMLREVLALTEVERPMMRDFLDLLNRIRNGAKSAVVRARRAGPRSRS